MFIMSIYQWYSQNSFFYKIYKKKRIKTIDFKNITELLIARDNL